MTARRLIGVLLLTSLAATACDAAPSAPATSPSGLGSPTPSAVPTPTAQPTSTPSPTPSPTPDQADVPLFQAGVQLKTLTTLRLRDLPGTNWGTSANLPPGAGVQVVLGPIRTDGYGWYLVRDADPAAPTFNEGWLAAGFLPDAFLAPSGAQPSPQPTDPVFVAGYAGIATADFGPFRVEGSMALRWAVTVPIGAQQGSTCNFTGSLKPADGAAVVFLTTTVLPQEPAPGTTQPSFFAAHPTLTGDVFLHVDTDCSWAVTVVRLPL